MSTVASRPIFAPWGWLALAAALWISAYANLTAFADAGLALIGLERGDHLGEAIHFFLYDTPKVLLLLVGVVFVMGVVHSFISPERTRAWLAGKPLGVGNVMAASLGIVTPFCSCSAVPLFIGFLSAGVPLGVTFSFLISAPMVNEVALALLFGLFGWKVAALYLVLGLTVAIVAGLIIGKLGLEHHLEDWVRAIRVGAAPEIGDGPPTWSDRLKAGVDHVKEIVGRVWPWLIAGIGVGAGIHGYVPAGFRGRHRGRRQRGVGASSRSWSACRMYSDAAGIIPVPKRCSARACPGHRAGLHDGGHRAVAAGNDHPAQGRETRRCSACSPPISATALRAGGLCVQLL